MINRYSCKNRVIAALSTKKDGKIQKLARKDCFLKVKNSNVILDFLEFPDNIFAEKTSLDKIYFENYDAVLLYIDKENLTLGISFALLVLEFTDKLIILFPKDISKEECSRLEKELKVKILREKFAFKTAKEIENEIENLLIFDRDASHFSIKFSLETENAIENIQKALRENLAYLFPTRFVAIQLLMGRAKRVSYLRNIYGAGFENKRLNETLKDELSKLKSLNLGRKKLREIYEKTIFFESEKLKNLIFKQQK